MSDVQSVTLSTCASPFSLALFTHVLKNRPVCSQITLYVNFDWQIHVQLYFLRHLFPRLASFDKWAGLYKRQPEVLLRIAHRLESDITQRNATLCVLSC